MLCNGLNKADNGYFTFQTIIDTAGQCSAISDKVCMGSPIIISICICNRKDGCDISGLIVLAL